MADDDVSTESFLKHALFNIKDNKSLIMIDERQELQEGQEVQDGQQEQEKQEGTNPHFTMMEITLLFSFQRKKKI